MNNTVRVCLKKSHVSEHMFCVTMYCVSWHVNWAVPRALHVCWKNSCIKTEPTIKPKPAHGEISLRYVQPVWQSFQGLYDCYWWKTSHWVFVTNVVPDQMAHRCSLILINTSHETAPEALKNLPTNCDYWNHIARYTDWCLSTHVTNTQQSSLK